METFSWGYENDLVDMSLLINKLDPAGRPFLNSRMSITSPRSVGL